MEIEPPPSDSSGTEWWSENVPNRRIDSALKAIIVTVTYSSRLSLPRQQLQFLLVAELYQNVNGPLIKVFMSADANFSSTTDACVPGCKKQRLTKDSRTLTIKRGSKFLADASNEGLQGRLPVVLRESE